MAGRETGDEGIAPTGAPFPGVGAMPSSPPILRSQLFCREQTVAPWYIIAIARGQGIQPRKAPTATTLRPCRRCGFDSRGHRRAVSSKGQDNVRGCFAGPASRAVWPLRSIGRTPRSQRGNDGFKPLRGFSKSAYSSQKPSSPFQGRDRRPRKCRFAGAQKSALYNHSDLVVQWQDIRLSPGRYGSDPRAGRHL